MEGLGNSDPNEAHQVDGYSDPINLFDSVKFLTSLAWNWNHFASILEMYSKRQITKEADTLVAFLGVMNHIRQSRPTTQLLRGLPFFRASEETRPVTLIDSFEELVTTALSWTSYEREFNSPQRQSTFPSWTWAGWNGEVRFWIGILDNQCFLRHAQLESSSGQTVVSSPLYKDNIQHELDTVTLIQFEAPMIPAASFSVAEDPYVATDSDDNSYSESLEFRVAGQKVLPDECLRIYTPDQLVENICKGIWSCFMLCAGEYLGERYSIFVLVVRWEADQVTAERIGSFQFISDPNEDARLGHLPEES
jgi:prolipoprotein diacylglyceryltransferase